MTVTRFRARLRNSEQFAATLERARQIPFGGTKIKTVNLVRNDWYMTRQNLDNVKRYDLPGAVSKSEN